MILKQFNPKHDLTMRLAENDEPMEIRLWQAGILDSLPPGVTHCIVDAWMEDGSWILAMRDLGQSMLGWESSISREECCRVLAAAVAIHNRLKNQRIAGLLSFETRITCFSQRVMGSLSGTDNELPASCLRGWERFAEAAPKDVVDMVFAIHERPEILTVPLGRLTSPTVLHGDLWLTNLALEAESVVVTDWALSTWGPPILEFTSFLAGCADQVRATREQILDDLRRLMGEAHDESALRLGLTCGIVEMGWNMAWHATEHPGKAGSEALDWWANAARKAMSMGLI